MVHVYHKFHYFDCLTGQHTWPHNHRLFHEKKKNTYSANFLDIFLKVVENTFTNLYWDLHMEKKHAQDLYKNTKPIMTVKSTSFP